MAEQFNADLDIIQATPIELELLDGNLNVIQQLDDEPNDVGGLTSAELKAKFDQAGNTIKQYINETLIPAILASDATEATRIGAEAARSQAESARAGAESQRAQAETARATAETARDEAEAGRIAAEQSRTAAEQARLTSEQGRSSGEADRVQAETARSAAETARVGAEADRATAEQVRITAEAARIAAEQARATAEDTRIAAEQARITAEAARIAAEQARNSDAQTCSAAEAARITAEAARDSAEQTRQANEQTRSGNEAARAAAEAARNVWEEFSAAKTYVPGNKVCFAGGSYLCTAECVGVAPTDPVPEGEPACWLCIAMPGLDGDMVQSVYDPTDRGQDIFAYTDERFDKVQTAALLQRNSHWIRDLDLTQLSKSSIVRGNNTIVMFLNKTTGLTSSTALEPWSSFSMPSPPNGSAWGHCIYGRNKFVALELGSGSEVSVLHSTDGKNWEIAGSMQWSTGSTSCAGLVYDSVHNTYVVCRENAPQSVMVSTNLVTWTEYETGATQGGGDGLLCTSGVILYQADSDNGFLFRSTDGGHTWTKVMDRQSGDQRGQYFLVRGQTDIFAIRKDNPHYVFRGTSDGTAWTQLGFLSLRSRLIDAVFSNGKYFVLPEEPCRIFYSANSGGIWGRVILPRATLWRRLLPIGGKCMAFAADGEVALSTNGQNWTSGIDRLQDTDGKNVTELVREALDVSTVELVTYVGGGQIGVNFPCRLEGSRPIKAAFALDLAGPDNKMLRVRLGYDYTAGTGFNGCHGKMSTDRKTYYWYGSTGAEQLNSSGKVYHFLLIE